MVYQNATPGLLPSEAERLGKITVGTELGWGAAALAEGIRYGRQGVLAAAINHGQLQGKIEPIGYHQAGTQRKLEIVDRECYTAAAVRRTLRTARRVRQGDETRGNGRPAPRF